MKTIANFLIIVSSILISTVCFAAITVTCEYPPSPDDYLTKVVYGASEGQTYDKVQVLSTLDLYWPGDPPNPVAWDSTGVECSPLNSSGSFCGELINYTPAGVIYAEGTGGAHFLPNGPNIPCDYWIVTVSH